MPEFNLLMTEAGRTLCGTPWNEYPRPTLRRNSFLNLNEALPACETPL